MHSLLKRQLRKAFGAVEKVPDHLREFVEGINAAYTQSDHDRAMLERSLELSSNELMMLNSDLRAIFEVLPDLFFRVAQDGKILECKAGAATDFLIPPDSLVGRQIQALPIPEAGQKFAAMLKAVIATQQMMSIEYSLSSGARTDFYEARMLPMANSQLITIVRDITERKQAEIALREGEARLRLIIDTAFDAIIGTDNDGNIIVWNPQAEQTFGWSRAEAIGRDFANTIVPEREREKYAAELKLFAHSGHSPLVGKRFEFTALHQDGHEIPVELAISPIHYNQAVFFSAFVRDLSERKQLQKDRELMELQLRQAQKLEAIGHLAAGIAHEINTPTQYIGDNTRFVSDTFRELEKMFKAQERLLALAREQVFAPELVAEITAASEAADIDYLRSEVPKAIDQALEGVERVTTIVKAMKEFSHPGSNEKVALDINRAIESTVIVCQNEWKYVADMEQQLEPDLPTVMCLPSEISQAMLNIIVNAAHAIEDAKKTGVPGKGKIRISTHSEPEWITIKISDTGAGIPVEAREKIFLPFFTTKGVGKGTGQGLAIARSVVVDKHGGTLDFETEIGKGTTFIIRLPLRAQSALVE